MRSIAVTIVFLSMLAQTTRLWLEEWKFRQNQDYVSRYLCEKREDRNNCCKGKCYLKKQLNKDPGGQGSPASPVTRESAPVYYLDSAYPLLTVPQDLFRKSYAAMARQQPRFRSTDPVLQPPEC